MVSFKAKGFLPKIFPDARMPAIIIDTIVGFIFIKNSSSKKIVNPPKKTTATHPAAAIIGMFLNQYQDSTRDNNVLITISSAKKIQERDLNEKN